jgi:hypothetical protein
VPTCESIPLAPRGFDNIFFIWKVLQFNPYTCGLSAYHYHIGTSDGGNSTSQPLSLGSKLRVMQQP